MSSSIKTDDTLEVTEPLVKFVSGQYDVSLVRSLTLSHLGIRALGNNGLQLCASLTRLELVGNGLTSLVGIEALGETLQRLDVSLNRITGIAPVAALVKLEVLHLEGNEIEDTVFINSLTSLKLLRALYMRSYDGIRTNPVCKLMPRYGETMMQRLPQLRCLDGHYFCQAELNPQRIDNGDDDEFVLPSSGPWLPEHFFSTKVFDYGQKVGVAAEKQFKQAAQDCRTYIETKGK